MSWTVTIYRMPFEKKITGVIIISVTAILITANKKLFSIVLLQRWFYLGLTQPFITATSNCSNVILDYVTCNRIRIR